MKTIKQAAKEFAESEVMETYDSAIEALKRISFIEGAKFAQQWISMAELDHIIEPIFIKDDEGNVGIGLTYVEDGCVFVNILRIYNPRNINEKVDKDLCTIVGWRPIERE